MNPLNVIVGVVAINFAFLLWWIVRVTMTKRRTLKKNGKLDFVDWYQAHKPEIMYRVRHESKLIGVDLEAKIDEQYQMYLLH